MANSRFGREAQSRRPYDHTAGWIERRRWRDEALSRLRAEAAALLGLPELTAPAKKEVPHPSKR